ncbi:MAG: hypothetical protein JWO67_215 [Streptosporangiaceae bacterium]|nr:hypothetical protein [Streptosporangiaceae bacterium]
MASAPSTVASAFSADGLMGGGVSGVMASS